MCLRLNAARLFFDRRLPGNFSVSAATGEGVSDGLRVRRLSVIGSKSAQFIPVLERYTASCGLDDHIPGKSVDVLSTSSLGLTILGDLGASAVVGLGLGSATDAV